jgi:hypothetical protein
VIFVDTTSTYWELEGADELAELAEQAADDEIASPAEGAVRTWGHSKTSRGSNCQAADAWRWSKAAASL